MQYKAVIVAIVTLMSSHCTLAAWSSDCNHVGNGFCTDVESNSMVIDIMIPCDGQPNCEFSQKRCERKCKRTKGCVGYEYSPVNKSCALKAAGISDVVRPNSNIQCFKCPWRSNEEVAEPTEPKTQSKTCTKVGDGFCKIKENSFPSTVITLCDGSSRCFYSKQGCSDTCADWEYCTGFEFNDDFGSCTVYFGELSQGVQESTTSAECFTCSSPVRRLRGD